MVLFNHSTRELTAKIVYYGPGLCGKTTNLRLSPREARPGDDGHVSSRSRRPGPDDLLRPPPGRARERQGLHREVPALHGAGAGLLQRDAQARAEGRGRHRLRRRLPVVDALAQPRVVPEPAREHGGAGPELRRVRRGHPVQQERSSPASSPSRQLQESLGFQEYPFVESIAADAKGVVETFKLVSKMTFIQILKRLQRSPDGRGSARTGLRPPLRIRSRACGFRPSAPAPRPDEHRRPRPGTSVRPPFETTASWPGSLERGGLR